MSLQRLFRFDENNEFADEVLLSTGTAISNKDGVLEIVGLDEVRTGEKIKILTDTDQIFGQAINLELNTGAAAAPGDGFGNPLSGKKEFEAEEYNYIEAKVLGIISRKLAHESLALSVLVAGEAVPIGRGIGDLSLGKPTVGGDSIISHKNNDRDRKCNLNSTGVLQTRSPLILPRQTPITARQQLRLSNDAPRRGMFRAALSEAANVLLNKGAGGMVEQGFRHSTHRNQPSALARPPRPQARP
jgi:hypothetical protein